VDLLAEVLQAFAGLGQRVAERLAALAAKVGRRSACVIARSRGLFERNGIIFISRPLLGGRPSGDPRVHDSTSM